MEPNKKSSSPPPATTILSFNDDIISEILVRLPSLASLARAACATKPWRRIARCPAFLRRFRALHGAPPLLGHFSLAGHAYGMPQVFHAAPEAVITDSGLAAAVSGITASLGQSSRYLEDCHRGLLLLSDHGTKGLTVMDPISNRSVALPVAPGHDDPAIFTSSSFLLPSVDDEDDQSRSTFRVATVQNTQRGELIRFPIYNSGAGRWSIVPWVRDTSVRPITIISKGQDITHWAYRSRFQSPMHAGGRVCCKQDAGDTWLSLDSVTMESFAVSLPTWRHGLHVFIDDN